MEEVYNVMNNVKDVLFSTVNVHFIVVLVLAVIACCLSLYLTWFGIRLLVNSVKSALNGDLSVNPSSSFLVGGITEDENYKLKKIWAKEKKTGLWEDYEDFKWCTLAENDDGSRTDIDAYYREVYHKY